MKRPSPNSVELPGLDTDSGDEIYQPVLLTRLILDDEPQKVALEGQEQFVYHFLSCMKYLQSLSFLLWKCSTLFV